MSSSLATRIVPRHGNVCGDTLYIDVVCMLVCAWITCCDSDPRVWYWTTFCRWCCCYYCCGWMISSIRCSCRGRNVSAIRIYCYSCRVLLGCCYVICGRIWWDWYNYKKKTIVPWYFLFRGSILVSYLLSQECLSHTLQTHETKLGNYMVVIQNIHEYTKCITSLYHIHRPPKVFGQICAAGVSG